METFGPPSIRENINILSKESLGYYELEKA
jgi:hypothetical protein